MLGSRGPEPSAKPAAAERASEKGQPLSRFRGALGRVSAQPGAMPFSASSFSAFLFLASCVSPMPRSTFGALVNWMLS